ncbi:hypothetical protein DSO57_1026616 [Entomophthora muscae]|uniref:Uncharacterized protein n=1 Tax=Entomophthora muscae TaxID=34485 RepID=A0ACC2SF98_9FUNG|nr:hypothetical protein DSO57_1026616 [Entomophthora muscae]
MCNDLDLDVVDHTLSASEGDKTLMPPLPSLGKSDLVPLKAPEVSPPTPIRTPWLLTGLMLMSLNAYFPQLSPVYSLWSPLQAAVPVLHWAVSWWFVSPVWEPNLVSLAPSLTNIIQYNNVGFTAVIDLEILLDSLEKIKKCPAIIGNP